MELLKPDNLIAYGAVLHRYEKGSIIFEEGQSPRYLFLIVEGLVKVVTKNNRSKELIQGMFFPGDTFGEPPVFINKPYTSTAIAVNYSVILRISIEKFFEFYNDHPELNLYFLRVFSKRIYEKSITAKIIISHSPEEKIEGFLNKTIKKYDSEDKILVPFTRQQIADFTGLRVETVIRSIGRLRDQGKLEIRSRKVFY